MDVGNRDILACDVCGFDQVCGHNQRASAMKGWGLSQNHGREYAKPELPLAHPIVIRE